MKKCLFTFRGQQRGQDCPSLPAFPLHSFSTLLIHPSLSPLGSHLLKHFFFLSSSALCRPGEERRGARREDITDLRGDRLGRGTMAALSGLLKTWVTLQILCLALAQVVSRRKRFRPAQLGFVSLVHGFEE